MSLSLKSVLFSIAIPAIFSGGCVTTDPSSADTSDLSNTDACYKLERKFYKRIKDSDAVLAKERAILDKKRQNLAEEEARTGYTITITNKRNKLTKEGNRITEKSLKHGEELQAISKKITDMSCEETGPLPGEI